MKYRTEKAKELDEKISSLTFAQMKEEKRCQDLFTNYCCMEGKYSNGIVNDQGGIGFRGYYYTYESPEIEKKEEEWREQYLKDNNYKTPDEIAKEYLEKIDSLTNEFNLEQYGLTTEQKTAEDLVKARKKELKKAEKALERAKEKLEEAINKFNSLK